MSTNLATKTQKLKKSKALDLRKDRRKKPNQRAADRRVASPRMVKYIENRRKALNLRAQGWTYNDIGEVLGASAGVISEMVRSALNLSLSDMKESTEEVRELQNTRLDMIVKGHMPFASEITQEIVEDKATGERIVVSRPPRVDSAMTVLKAEERRSKLLALDVPEIKKLEVSGIREYVNIDISQVIGSGN
jgi:predicted transcriptional regulator